MADILALAQETLAGTEYELVDVERAPLGLLRIVIDHPEGVRIEHCEWVSKQLSRVFEVENVDYKRMASPSGTSRSAFLCSPKASSAICNQSGCQ